MSTAANAGSLFPPQSEKLKIDIRDTYSPGIVKKIVYSAAHATSFAQSERDLAELAEVQVGAKQVQRIGHRVGNDLIEQSRQAIQDHQTLPLVEKERSPTPNPPNLAVVQMDGGRYQQRHDAQPTGPVDDLSMEEEPQDPEKAGHWREDKIGLLMTMSSAVHDVDPHPEIPAVFLDQPAVKKLVTEVGHQTLGGKEETPGDRPSQPDADPHATLAEPSVESGNQYEPPKVLVRTMVATTEPIGAFAKLLAQAAWARGFAQAARKAFVADGASANWNTWKKWFSSYTPIIDFIHVLSYVYLAAHAIHRTKQQVWEAYCRWIPAVWSGKVADVIAELRQQQLTMGLPEPDDSLTAPRKQLAKAIGYLENNQSRMHYDQYRRQGLPLTSCHVESTVKLFNKRVKGTEKFWSSGGAEAMLCLKAAYLSETGVMAAYWEKRYSAQAPSPTPALAL